MIDKRLDEARRLLNPPVLVASVGGTETPCIEDLRDALLKVLDYLDEKDSEAARLEK
jgi:hypothetical protein